MVHEIHARNVLTKSSLPESAYCLNPYIGCTHACAYCYARFMRRFTGHQKDVWGKFVDVKINTSECLERQLRSNTIHGSVLLGSVCDAYQPLEKKYQLTRDAVRQLAAKKVTISILTKSDLVLRDIDLLQTARANCSVGISLALLDETMRQHFEPGASSVAARLEALKQLHAAGIRTYLFIGPIMPGITDLNAILDTTAGDVDEIWAEALNLRCGNRDDMAYAYARAGLPPTWETQARNPEYWHTIEANLRERCNAMGKHLVGFYRH